MPPKVALDFLDIRERLRRCTLPDVDRVVGIGSGGIVPAALVAYQLERPLSILPINYRSADNTPRYEQPRLLEELSLPAEDRHLLLVDDVSVSGKTLELAQKVLAGHITTTFVMKGQADIVLFPEISDCVEWPWRSKK